MKLQAVMENLQRQQRARLQQALEARQQEQQRSTPPPVQPPPAPGQTPASTPARGRGQDPAPAPLEEGAEPESVHIQRAQMAALAAMRAAAAGLSHSSSPGLSEESQASEEEEEEEEERGEEEDGGYQQEMGSEEEDLKGKWDEDDFEEDMGEEEEEEEEEEDYEEEEDMGEEGLSSAEAVRAGAGSLLLRKPPAPQHYRGEPQRLPGGPERLPPGPGQTQAPPPAPDHGDWTYEEQFKQLYELDGDPRRKEFLDDLFSFMQKRGTPVNRIPIMAKQVLDLYMLYTLVTEKGGLVEVINKKLWREITKGLNLPTSITSAAFTLRTQYMKYLYPYECEKRGLSNPNELQAAIDSNRREGRRQGFGSSLFTYSPGGTHSLLSSPKLPVPALGLASATNGGSIAPVQKIKKEEDSPIPISMPSRLPVSLAGHPVVAAQAAAVQVAAAAQAVALEQLREKLESGEPPEKKLALVTDEQQRLMQRALQQNLLAMTAQLPMSIRINSQGTRSPENRPDSAGAGSNGTNSISMSVEINGIVYTGVLFAQTPGPSSSSSSSSLPSSAYSKGNSSGRSGGAVGSGGGSVPPGTPASLAVPPSSTSNNASP
ncbi:AT-rich interactive domain-containing protein 3A [Apus apus]|uniref:AT-rich interactive domain-containing protein 3A n=1 Tax=Apus apus TaxID=8895 RepID=UPI0021F857DD|nr:AT-rich interactive domain-containing protein 3A [Apus apus]XP_051495767.1 AT-rich interactive domain-containing protein 3A [Apus apus]